jgi:predicted DNA-binding transcriptional regulator AlpA
MSWSRDPLTLAECGDALTPEQICRVLQIGRSHYYALIRHRAFPIKPMPGLGVTRYAKVSIELYLSSTKPGALRRVI